MTCASKLRIVRITFTPPTPSLILHILHCSLLLPATAILLLPLSTPTPPDQNLVIYPSQATNLDRFSRSLVSFTARHQGDTYLCRITQIRNRRGEYTLRYNPIDATTHECRDR
ncbi:hypothetical protein F4811DRAFT_137711 [Daldinia bambusicola]|nr:hypothetical protein F4811DRAFT_137711 [Daldinia bambusicola]